MVRLPKSSSLVTHEKARPSWSFALARTDDFFQDGFGTA